MLVLKVQYQPALRELGILFWIEMEILVFDFQSDYSNIHVWVFCAFPLWKESSKRFEY